MTETKQPGLRFFVVFMTVLYIALHFPARTIAQNGQQCGTEHHTLNIPVAVFIVDAEGDVAMSSQRTIGGMTSHFQKVNKVWSQAGIKLDPVKVQRLSVPRNLVRGLIHERGRGGIARFFRAIRQGEIEIDRSNSNAAIWIFYVRNLGGPNGLKPQGSNSIFVVDDPINEGYRLTSHEIGHILGLYHARDDIKKLLFSGSNGLILTNTEKTVARYFAKRLSR